jgi:hypothetical protein
LVAVDVQAAARAFERLFQAPELRRQLGEAGRARAQAVYDWKAVMAQYEALWARQQELRLAQAPGLKPLAHPWPARMDPFHAFAAYPTQLLTPQTQLGLATPGLQAAQERARAWRALAMVDFAREVLPTEAETQEVLQAAAAGPCTAAQLVAQVQPQRQAMVLRSLVWMVKLGVLAVAEQPEVAAVSSVASGAQTGDGS